MKADDSQKCVQELVSFLGKIAPYDFAEDWDNVGLICGNPQDLIQGIVISVNLCAEALEAAKKLGYNVVVCHHPPIFKPVHSVTKLNLPNVFDAIKNGISVICLHTNFDLSSEDLSRELSQKIGFEFEDFLALRNGIPPSIQQAKFITYVPENAVDVVREAVCRAGAGKIGAYNNCSFSWDGEGTFFGGQETKPTVGTAGKLERVKERRLEVVFPLALQEKILEAAKKSHPYEEMAYDIIRLEKPAQKIGYGFVATRPEHLKHSSFILNFQNFVDSVKQVFGLRSVTIAGVSQCFEGDLKKIAFSPGSGSGFVNAAVAQGVQVYVCGEVGYHQMLEAKQRGLALVLLGHSYSEKYFVESLAKWCFNVTNCILKVFENIQEVA